MKNSQRGDIAIFIETIIVIAVILGFLIAVKVQTRPLTPEQQAARETYPRTPGSAQIGPVKAPPYIAEQPPERTAAYEVIYTDAGFVPDIVTITGNNRVIVFRNQSSGKMWVATDPYPINDDFPLFNQGTGVAKGGVYWFAFPPGAREYGYHNQLRPGHRGTITVK